MEIILIRHTSVDVPKGTCYGQTDVPLKPTFEQEAAIKQQENKAAQDALIRSDIHNSMLNKALTDGVSMGLTMEQVDLLKQMKNGKTVSSFSQSE